MSPGEGADGKDVAYFSALVTAWIETKMERDKTIVTLSAGAIGLLVTLLTTVGVKTPWMLLLYTGAVGGFAVAAGYSIVIFDSNSVHIEEVIKGGTEDNKTLRRLDKRTLTFFTLGVIFTVLIGVTAAVTSLHHGAPDERGSQDVTNAVAGNIHQEPQRRAESETAQSGWIEEPQRHPEPEAAGGSTPAGAGASRVRTAARRRDSDAADSDEAKAMRQYGLGTYSLFGAGRRTFVKDRS